MIGKIKFNDYKLFGYFSLFWVCLGWVAFLLTLAGFFHAWILLAFLILGIVLFVYFVFFKKYYKKTSQNLHLTSLFILLITISFSLFSTPTIFSGRDQGSISEAAIRLSQNHQLKFSTPASKEFFQINQAQQSTQKESFIKNLYSETNTLGKALNFPGFHYTPDGQLTTQFPPVYISWLATFYSIFGTSGFAIANAILFFLFLMSMYLIACSLSLSSKNLYGALLCTVFTIFSFLFSWFIKFTLSENMALALIWTGIFQIVAAFQSEEKKDRKLFTALSIATLGLMIFTRIEGILIFAMMVLAFFLQRENRKTLIKNKWKLIILPLTALVVIFAINFFSDIAFYKEMAKAIIKAEESGLSSKISTIKIFSIYGITLFFVLAIIEVYYLLKNKDYKKLLPLFITLPAFIYVINPQISSDHPWMLRRFLFAVLPALILYSSLLIARISYRKVFWANSLIIIVIALNLPLTINFFTFSENKDLLEQTEKISQNFTPNDLVLIDRDTTGDGWSMISGPMNFVFKKNSAYFFNPADFDRINKAAFENIYLICPEEKIEFYKNSSLGNKMGEYNEYSISTTRLQKNSGYSIPKKETVSISGKIFQLK